MLYDEWHPVTAWATWARYTDECDRGIVHTDEWVERMKELGEALRQAQNDVRVYRGVLQNNGESRSKAASLEFDQARI